MSKFYAAAIRILPVATVLVMASQTVLAQSNPCAIPFTQMVDTRTGSAFQIKDAINDSDEVSAEFNMRNRYLVADLDTRNEQGQCKGFEERYPMIDVNNPDVATFPDLQDSETLANFMSSIQGKFYETPASQGPVVLNGGAKYCVGQTVSLCEIRNGAPVEVVRLATSGMNKDSSPTLYASYNSVVLRSWAKDRGYSKADGNRDILLGGVSSDQQSGVRLSKYVSGGGWVMPNFVQWRPLPGYEKNNAVMGLHQLTRGESNVVIPGSPVSHGCFRLSKYGAVLNRWWTPRNARMFINFTKKGYRQSVPSSQN
jgi:hypothetical protein